MKVRGYLIMSLNGYNMAGGLSQEWIDSGNKIYTFEVEAPHVLTELKVVPESVAMVAGEGSVSDMIKEKSRGDNPTMTKKTDAKKKPKGKKC